MNNSVGQNARIVTEFQKFILLLKELKAEMEGGANVNKMTPDSTAQGLYVFSVWFEVCLWMSYCYSPYFLLYFECIWMI